MTDHEIHDCIDKKNAIIINTVTSLFDSHTSSIVTLITNETEGIKKHIEKLEEQVTIQNGSVKGLREWKAGIEGGDAYKDKTGVANRQKTQIYISAILGIASIIITLIIKYG